MIIYDILNWFVQRKFQSKILNTFEVTAAINETINFDTDTVRNSVFIIIYYNDKKIFGGTSFHNNMYLYLNNRSIGHFINTGTTFGLFSYNDANFKIEFYSEYNRDSKKILVDSEILDKPYKQYLRNNYQIPILIKDRKTEQTYTSAIDIDQLNDQLNHEIVFPKLILHNNLHFVMRESSAQWHKLQNVKIGLLTYTRRKNTNSGKVVHWGILNDRTMTATPAALNDNVAYSNGSNIYYLDCGRNQNGDYHGDKLLSPNITSIINLNKQTPLPWTPQQIIERFIRPIDPTNNTYTDWTGINQIFKIKLDALRANGGDTSIYNDLIGDKNEAKFLLGKHNIRVTKKNDNGKISCKVIWKKKFGVVLYVDKKQICNRHSSQYRYMSEPIYFELKLIIDLYHGDVANAISIVREPYMKIECRVLSQ